MLRRSFWQFANIAASSGVRPAVASFEIAKVSDVESEGFMIRVSYLPNDQLLSITHFPQLGPRKEDPSDQVPQFDVNRRTSARFGQHDMGRLIALLEGKTPDSVLESDKWKLNVSRTDSALTIKGNVIVRKEKGGEKPFEVVFEAHRVTQLHHFVDAALSESLGGL